jgi:hypothetical protein
MTSNQQFKSFYLLMLQFPHFILCISYPALFRPRTISVANAVHKDGILEVFQIA